jgi:hypothetical protein
MKSLVFRSGRNAEPVSMLLIECDGFTACPATRGHKRLVATERVYNGPALARLTFAFDICLVGLGSVPKGYN